MPAPIESLPDDPSALKAMVIAEREQNARLKQIIKELQRHRFGRRAETLPEDQMLLALEEVEQTLAGIAQNANQDVLAGHARQTSPRRSNRGSTGASAAGRGYRRR